MAIKALATIPLRKEIDIKSYYRYYLSVMSTLGTPTINNTTVRPPTSTIGGTTYTWSTTQPPFATTGTYTLYFVDCTVFSDDSMKYSDVSVDSEYEAAKQAYNLAYNTNEKVDNLKVGGKNLLRGSGSLPVSTTNTSTTCIWSNGLWYASGGSAGTITSGVTLPDPPIPTVTTGVRVTATTTNTQIGIAQGGVPILAGEITHSVWAKGVAGDKIRLQPIWTNASSSCPESGLKEFTIPDNQWHRYTFTKTVLYDHPVGTRTSTADNTFCNAGYIYLLAATAGNSCYFCGNKIEYGNIATDWTIAPEDTEAFIDNAAKVATNFMSFDNTGLMIYDSLDLGTTISPSDVTSTHTFRNVLIDSDSVDIRTGTNVLASFGETTTIGSTSLVGYRYITLTSSSMGIYKKKELGSDDIDFLVQGASNTDDYETVTIPYSSSSPFMLSFDNGINAGYTSVKVVCMHPNGATWEEDYDLTTYVASGASGTFTPSTGDSYTIDWLGNGADVYISLGSSSSAIEDLEFWFKMEYSGGATTALYLGGNDQSANLAVLSTGKIYSQNRAVNMEYNVGDIFNYGGDGSYWVVGGYITSSKRSIWFSVTLPRNLPRAGNNCIVNVKTLKIAIRSQNTSGAGGYVGTTSSKASENGQQFVGLSGITINASVATANTVTFQITKSSDFAISTGTLANNVPLGIRIISLSLEFSYGGISIG